MLVIFYDDDAHLLRLLKTRNDPTLPAVVLLPRGLGWLVADKKLAENGTNSQPAGMAAEKK